VDSLEFSTALTALTSLRIKAEMSTNKDSASLDSIRVGSQYLSTFDSGIENWSIHNDATMVWDQHNGYEGGCITLLDWTSGTYFYAVSPPSWAGNWQTVQGDTLSFYIRVNYCVTPGAVELHTDTTKRLSFLIEGEPSVPEGDSARILLTVEPSPTADLSVSLSASNSSCITPQSSVTIPAGSSSVAITVSAAASSAGCESVIQANVSGYTSARLTMTSTDALHTMKGYAQRSDFATVPQSFYDRQGNPVIVVPHGVRGVIHLYSMAGARLHTYTAEGNGSRISLRGLRAGMYVARLSLETGSKTFVICRQEM